MKAAFDPFDERHRDKVKRRKPSEVEYDRRCWRERVDAHFKKVLDQFGWPDYVESSAIYQELNYIDWNLEPTSLKRHMKDSLERLGYDKMTNENSKDGRWKTPCGYTFVYFKRGLPRIGKRQLKQALTP